MSKKKKDRKEIETQRLSLRTLLDEHPDYRLYFCTKRQSYYLTLGYFGGGSINIHDALQMAEEFAKMIDVPLETVQIDEILKSRRFKGFKFLFSTQSVQSPSENSKKIEDVWEWLTG